MLFLEHVGLVFQLIAYGPATKWSTQQAVAERALKSFAVLTDRAALDIQPQRLQVIRVDRGGSLSEMRGRRESPLTAEQLAVLNQVRVGDVLPVGRLVKWVTGPALP